MVNINIEKMKITLELPRSFSSCILYSPGQIHRNHNLMGTDHSSSKVVYIPHQNIILLNWNLINKISEPTVILSSVNYLSEMMFSLLHYIISQLIPLYSKISTYKDRTSHHPASQRSTSAFILHAQQVQLEPLI